MSYSGLKHRLTVQWEALDPVGAGRLTVRLEKSAYSKSTKVAYEKSGYSTSKIFADSSFRCLSVGLEKSAFSASKTLLTVGPGGLRVYLEKLAYLNAKGVAGSRSGLAYSEPQNRLTVRSKHLLTIGLGWLRVPLEKSAYRNPKECCLQ